MEDATRAHYWCYICSQMVNPAAEAEIKCPHCQTGFVEEIGSVRPSNNIVIDLGSLAASMLLGLMGGLASSRPRIRGRDQGIDTYSDDEDQGDQLRREIESRLGRRRSNMSGSSPRVFEEPHNIPGRERRPGVVLFNPVNQAALMLHTTRGLNYNPSIGATSSLGDHLVGPGLDLLLQHLAENSPGRYGSLPASKEAVKALPNVTVGENTRCSVCLEDFPVGSEAMEMPCKHKFHGECILPWLELHCSCPVCRRELPSENSITETNLTRNNGDRGATDNAQNSAGEMTGEGRRLLIPIPWSFEGMLTLMGSQSADNSSEEPSPVSITDHGNQN